MGLRHFERGLGTNDFGREDAEAWDGRDDMRPRLDTKLGAIVFAEQFADAEGYVTFGHLPFGSCNTIPRVLSKVETRFASFRVVENSSVKDAWRSS
jgi:hypothetical protein